VKCTGSGHNGSKTKGGSLNSWEERGRRRTLERIYVEKTHEFPSSEGKWLESVIRNNKGAGPMPGRTGHVLGLGIKRELDATSMGYTVQF